MREEEKAMTDQDKTKPQTSTGGPLDIREEHVTPIGTEAELKEKPEQPNRQSRLDDVNKISEKTDGDGQHQIKKEVDEATDLPQKGSA
jgi:hypothetical protein